ncbi:hypothetical protein [Lactobacillus delbrueckii]|uniref:hypothetical protein n=1 Tax=Lactobacillus delbrueckii TaxID=1584 RepID=UPI001E5ACD47|nr:hypothetical protein [Lactobacillus delbrueckii]MCD5558643.1 hypothetical protein [Lactobacillus delbrueckii subsp. lactis]MCT3502795.1 hypothetical protein [Lactobacillus delbrueckii subsp. lactis]MCT3520263.1 hypothetical protein [Lactobacillus delbrueckii subsp. lactis]
MTPNLTAFTGVDSQNLPDVMVSVQFILAIGVFAFLEKICFFLGAVFYSFARLKRQEKQKKSRPLGQLLKLPCWTSQLFIHAH